MTEENQENNIVYFDSFAQYEMYKISNTLYELEKKEREEIENKKKKILDDLEQGQEKARTIIRNADRLNEIVLDMFNAFNTLFKQHLELETKVIVLGKRIEQLEKPIWERKKVLK